MTQELFNITPRRYCSTHVLCRWLVSWVNGFKKTCIFFELTFGIIPKVSQRMLFGDHDVSLITKISQSSLFGEAAAHYKVPLLTRAVVCSEIGEMGFSGN